jgi:hypothetical protein
MRRPSHAGVRRTQRGSDVRNTVNRCHLTLVRFALQREYTSRNDMHQLTTLDGTAAIVARAPAPAAASVEVDADRPCAAAGAGAGALATRASFLRCIESIMEEMRCVYRVGTTKSTTDDPKKRQAADRSSFCQADERSAASILVSLSFFLFGFTARASERAKPKQSKGTVRQSKGKLEGGNVVRK